MGGALDLGFEGFDSGSQWVGDSIWVLGVSTVSGGLDLGFGGCGGVSIRLGLMVTICCHGLTMVAERGRREINDFFLKII